MATPLLVNSPLGKAGHDEVLIDAKSAGHIQTITATVSSFNSLHVYVMSMKTNFATHLRSLWLFNILSSLGIIFFQEQL